MTEKIFWQDPYRTTLETRVVSVDGAWVRLAETVFFALSGGQESDSGTIGGRPVREARKTGKEIDYRLDEGHGLAGGDPVQIVIDWPRRYRLMRLHFAAEIVLELVYRRLAGIEKIGAHIAEAKARIDFRWPENIARHLPELERDARRIIAANREIISLFGDEENERRYWKICDFDPVPCGGTHLRSTGEVGDIALKRRNVGKEKERIDITLTDPSVPPDPGAVATGTQPQSPGA